MDTKTRLSVSISPDLRRQLEEARQDSDWKKSVFRTHTLGAEVEELLRIGLKARAGGNFITLQMDDGIWAWVTAYQAGYGNLWGSLEDCVISMIRAQIILATEKPSIAAMVLPHLPPSIQEAMRRG